MDYIQGKINYNQHMIDWLEDCLKGIKNPQVLSYVKLIIERLKEEKVSLLEEKIKLLESNNDSNSDTK